MYGFGLWFLAFIFLCTSCKDEIIVGSDLLDDEIIMVDVTDQVVMQSEVEYREPFVTFDSVSLSRRTVLAGKIQDGVFGSLTPSLALMFNLNTSSLPAYPVGEKPLLADSLVLALTYDTLATYGSLQLPFRLSVSALKNRLPSGSMLKSDLEILTSEILADTLLYVKPKDSVRIVNPATKQTVSQLPQMRIKLPYELANRILFDTLAAVKDSAFAEIIKGVLIKASAADSRGIFGFNLSAQALSSSISNKLILYYTESDTIKKSYAYSINRRFANIAERDYTASNVEATVADSTLGNEIAYVQGFGGPMLKLTFKDLSVLNDKIINFARLYITAENKSGNFGEFPACNQLFAFKKNSKGDLEIIDDIIPVSLSTAIAVFGGTKKETAGKAVYTMNITNQLKAFLKDPTLQRSIYLSVPEQSENVQRAIIYGAGHGTDAIRLKVNFTSK